MASLVRNTEYSLRHVDAATGFGILFSARSGDCVFLNPLAAALWKADADAIDPDQVVRTMSEAIDQPGAADYMRSVVANLCEKGLLHGAGEDRKLRSPEDAATGAVPALAQMYFYVTRDCNARCYHCYQPTVRASNESLPRKYGQLGVETIAKLVDDALPLGLRKIKFTGGEPLLRSDLREILDRMSRPGLAISIETNGYLLDEQFADFVIERGINVSISLDGGTAKVHDKLRGHQGSFARATRALRLLSERGGEPYAIMSISRLNAGEVDKVLEVAAANGCRLVKLNPVNTLGLAQKFEGKAVLLPTDDIMRLYDRRASLESKYGVFLFVEGPPAFASIYELVAGHSAVCPFTQILGILADGTISFCGIGNSYPELVLGAVTDEGFDLRAFWEGNGALRKVREGLSRPTTGVCSRCVLERFCKGSCRALAYSSFRSFSASHPWCQKALEEGLFPSHYLKPSERSKCCGN